MNRKKTLLVAPFSPTYLLRTRVSSFLNLLITVCLFRLRERAGWVLEILRLQTKFNID
ncbi:hypothetical protein LguiA_030360 [Lonicera macranthoides]